MSLRGEPNIPPRGIDVSNRSLAVMNDIPHVKITPDPLPAGTIFWRVLFALLLVGIMLAVNDLLVTTISILMLMFAGMLFGIFLNGIGQFLTKYTPLPYRASFVVITVVLATLVVLGFIYLGSQVANQASALRSQLSRTIEQFPDQLGEYAWIQNYLPTWEQVQQTLANSGGDWTQVMQGVQWVIWALTGTLVILFVGLYAAFDPDLYTYGLVKVVPQQRRGRAIEVLHALHSALGHWIVGRLISMAIIGVCTVIGLWWLGVPLPITLGVIAALLTFIPNIGPVLAAIPQALLALQVDTTTAFYVILFNVGLQTFESYLITPIIQKYEVTLPPIVTIFFQLLLGVLIGGIGIIVAAPLAVVIMLLVQMLYVDDRLGDPAPGRLANRTA